MLHVATAHQLAVFMTKHLRAPAHILATDIVLGGFPLPKEGHVIQGKINLLKTSIPKNSMLELGDIECY
jgi:hypothetical protein